MISLPQPIKLIAPLDKQEITISETITDTGKNIVVSRDKDDIWDYWPYIHVENKPALSKRINWNVKLPDGSMLTSPEHHDLLTSAKDFILSLYMEPIEGRIRPKIQTVRSKYEKSLIPLIRWMVSQGITQFSLLEGRTFDYISYAKLGVKGQKLYPHSVAKRLCVLEELYYQRHKLLDSLNSHPWPHESSIALAGLEQKGTRKSKTELIPETVAK